jgi:hypothetical protein
LGRWADVSCQGTKVGWHTCFRHRDYHAEDFCQPLRVHGPIGAGVGSGVGGMMEARSGKGPAYLYTWVSILNMSEVGR